MSYDIFDKYLNAINVKTISKFYYKSDINVNGCETNIIYKNKLYELVIYFKGAKISNILLYEKGCNNLWVSIHKENYILFINYMPQKYNLHFLSISGRNLYFPIDMKYLCYKFHGFFNL